VTGVAGVELKVETITDSDRNLQIIVTERRSGVRPPSMDAIRVQLETDPAAKPIRISHQFDGKNGLATHSYYFSPGQRIYADRARILIATARDVKERAWKLASGLAVPVGRGGSFDSPASDVGTVSGQVLYFEQALRMAEVTLEALDGTEIGQETTDKDGRFTFSRVPPGKYVLKARAPLKSRSRCFPTRRNRWR
jgi:hypothetical protein